MNSLLRSRDYHHVALIDSNYTLFLYYLIFSEQVGDTLFIVSCGVNREVREKIENCLYLRDSNYNSLKKIREILRNLSLILSPDLIKLRVSKNIKFYGQDHAWFSFIGRNKDFTLLEDGLDNYIVKPNTSIKRKIFSYLGFPFKEFGRRENIKSIYLTGITIYPSDIKYKVSTVVLDDLWKKLSYRDKEKITKLYGVQLELIEPFIQRENINLLLTQPLSQDGFMSESKKIKIYKQATSILGNVLVKVHPRDHTNYRKYGFDVLPSKFAPLELLTLLGLKIDKVITYNSTSVYRYDKNKRIIINRKFN